LISLNFLLTIFLVAVKYCLAWVRKYPFAQYNTDRREPNHPRYPKNTGVSGASRAFSPILVVRKQAFPPLDKLIGSRGGKP
jgi:hypothetical protein